MVCWDGLIKLTFEQRAYTDTKTSSIGIGKKTLQEDQHRHMPQSGNNDKEQQRGCWEQGGQEIMGFQEGEYCVGPHG